MTFFARKRFKGNLSVKPPYDDDRKFAKLLELVKEGSLPANDALIDFWPKTPDKMVRAVEALLPNLRVQIPEECMESKTPGMKLTTEVQDVVYRAASCLDGFYLLRAPHHQLNKDIVAKAVNLYRTNLDIISAWIMYLTFDNTKLLARDTTPMSLGGLLSSWITLDNKLDAAILASPVVLDLMVHLSTSEHVKLHPPIVQAKFRMRDAMIFLKLLTIFLEDTKGRATLLAEISARPRSAVDRFTRRIGYCIDVLQHFVDSSRPAEVSSSEKDMVQNILILLEINIEFLSSDQRFNHFLQKNCQYILKYFVLHKGLLAKSLFDTETVFGSSTVVLTWASRHRTQAIPIILELLKTGGILEYLASFFAFQKAANARGPLELLFWYVGSRRVQKALEAAIDGLPARIQNRLNNPSLVEHRIWNYLERIHTRFADFEVFEDPVNKVFCFNVQHASRKGIVAATGPMKACSGCHTVTYCSTDCQAEDWKNIHRFECAKLNGERKVAAEEDVYIPHGLRFHYLPVAKRWLHEAGHVPTLLADERQFASRIRLGKTSSNSKFDDVPVHLLESLARDFRFGEVSRVISASEYIKMMEKGNDKAHEAMDYFWSRERFERVVEEVRRSRGMELDLGGDDSQELRGDGSRGRELTMTRELTMRRNSKHDHPLSLLAFAAPYGSVIVHILFMAPLGVLGPGSAIPLWVGMVQLEYIKAKGLNLGG
ncbi:hypothetical protein CC2G_013405 [Coprinopsis cinerea AmutBmut pab1-1]|nr:hypothetical protein CC2G_013405 [Coprinopsis cinerea AmutBmut pab1-1]